MKGKNSNYNSKILGMSLLEILIAITITSLIVGSVMGFFSIVLRINKATTTQLNCAAYAKKLVERLSFDIRNGIYVNIPSEDNGNTLLIYSSEPIGVMKGYYFHDEDFDVGTINNNTIILDEDINDDTNELKVLARYVTPIGSNPIFEAVGTTSPTNIYYDPVMIKFRIGDPTLDVSAGFNKDTGVGIQGINIDTIISLRNTALPTATPSP